MKPENDQEENELVILHLRQLCESKQKTHIHIGEAPSVKLIFSLFLYYSSSFFHPIQMQPRILARPLLEVIRSS